MESKPTGKKSNNKTLGDWNDEQILAFVSSVLLHKGYKKTKGLTQEVKFTSIKGKIEAYFRGLKEFIGVIRVDDLKTNPIFKGISVPDHLALRNKWVAYSKQVLLDCAVSDDNTNLSAREGEGPTEAERIVINMHAEIEQEMAEALIMAENEDKKSKRMTAAESAITAQTITSPTIGGVAASGAATEAQPKNTSPQKRQRLELDTSTSDHLRLIIGEDKSIAEQELELKRQAAEEGKLSSKQARLQNGIEFLNKALNNPMYLFRYSRDLIVDFLKIGMNIKF